MIQQLTNYLNRQDKKEANKTKQTTHLNETNGRSELRVDANDHVEGSDESHSPH
jgi:hypothetical protein